jgi:hypothetical protein
MFDIVEWISLDGEPAPKEEEAVEDEAPATRRRRA